MITRRSVGYLFVASLVLFSLAPVVSFGQDVDLPLTWKGQGHAVGMDNGEIADTKLEVIIKVDEDGWVTGKFSTETEEAAIEHFYYGPEEDGVRKLVVVLVQKDNGKLFVISGRMLLGQLFYGEVFAKAYEKEGDIEKGLSIGDRMAQEIYSDYIPQGLEKALKKCKPIGILGAKGSF